MKTISDLAYKINSEDCPACTSYQNEHISSMCPDHAEIALFQKGSMMWLGYRIKSFLKDLPKYEN